MVAVVPTYPESLDCISVNFTCGPHRPLLCVDALAKCAA